MPWVVSVLVLVGLLGPQSSRAQTRPDGAARVVRTFSMTKVTKVIVRAETADTARVVIEPTRQDVEVSGLPMGGTRGYHSPDPNWRETPASEWGLDFVTARFGGTLVISTKNEMRYIHHHYALSSLTLRVPDGVQVTRESRQLTADGRPDLNEPKAR